MPALIDNMFSVRQVPWHGLGTIVKEAPKSDEAIKLAGLDWEVVQEKVYAGGQEVKGYYANIRSDNGKVLGIVTQRYKVVQNREAFAFTDLLLGEGLEYETAGSLREGRLVWLLGRLPEVKILDDITIPYVVFVNGHDGFYSIKVALTPVRVVCYNTLVMALNGAPRVWSVRHVGNLSEKTRRSEKNSRIDQ